MYPACRECVGDPVRADGEGLLNIQLHRKLGARVDHHRLPAEAHLARFRQHGGDRRHHGADRRPRGSLRRCDGVASDRANQDRELVGRPWSSGGDTPVRDELLALEDSDRDLGVADVEHDNH